MSNYLLSAESIMSDDVKNAKGEKLGNIKELMINPATGKVEYAVLAFGGFLGLGDKYFAIPFESISVDRNNKCLVLNVEKEQLDNAPGFDKDNWPDMANPQFRDQIYNHYGVTYKQAA